MNRPLSSRLLILALPLLLAAGIVVLGGVAATSKIESFQPLGFAASRDAGGWRVDETTAPATGLEVADQILFVGGQPLGTAAEVRGHLMAEPETELLVLRGGEVVEVLYHRPDLDIDWTYLLLALTGVCFLLIGLYTVFKQPGSQGMLFFLWCLASAAMYLLTPTGSVATLLDRSIVTVEDVSRLLLPPLILHLFLLFPRPLHRGRWVGRLVPFLYLPAVILGTILADWTLGSGVLLGPPTAASLELFDQLGWALLSIYVLAALGALLLRLDRAVVVEERQQLRWMTLGMAGYLPFLLLYVAPRALSLTPPEGLVTATVVPLALVPLTFAYAILRYKLWDIHLIVRNTIASTLTVFLGVLGFAVVNLFLSRGIPAELAQARTAASFVAGLVIAGLMVPARRGIGTSLERIQYGSHFGRRQTLAELGRELLHERDLDQLCASLLEHLEVGLQLTEVNLFLVQRGSLVAVRPGPGLPVQVPVSFLSEEAWEEEVTAISGLEVLGEASSPRRALFLAGYRYAFPLTIREGRAGVLLSGYKLGEKPLDSEDLELIRQVLNQAALAIENARLLDELHHQLEEVLRLKQYNEGIIQSSPAGIAVLGSAQGSGQGEVLSANLAFAALLGRERRTLLGQDVGEILPVTLPSPADGLCEASFEGPEGEERYLQLSVSELGEGTGRQRILMVQDVTERVHIEQKLKEKERLASLGMLAAGVAHEVNTPITGISSYAQMLLEDTPEDDPRHEMLRKMERQTFRAARIVASLLDFARNRRGEHQPLDVMRALHTAADDISDRARERGVEVVRNLPRDGGGGVVMGSETELTQVFVNLVSNAVDAMPGGGTLSLAVENLDDRVVAVVEDTGCGIAPSELEKIFQPFFSTKLTQGGTGLGLSISYEIVRRHGGQMRVASQVGKGSRFMVELPRYPSQGLAEGVPS